MKKMAPITLLVAVPNGGLSMFAHMVSVARATASGPVLVMATAHDRQHAEAIEPMCDTVLLVDRYQGDGFYGPSVTHSRCINAMFRYANRDGIRVICDYDTAFVRRGWDDILRKRMGGLDVFGSPYANDIAKRFNANGIEFGGMKYQGLPNAIFLAYTQRLRNLAGTTICDFAATYASGECIPAKLISTPREAAIYGLPVGYFLHVDTGSRLPGLIRENNLRYECLERRVGNYGVINQPEGAGWPIGMCPEEYWLDGKPFVVHFRKGSTKTDNEYSAMRYSPGSFMNDVRRYLEVQECPI